MGRRAVDRGARARHASRRGVSRRAFYSNIRTAFYRLGHNRNRHNEWGRTISAGQFVFACGAWLGKVFPELLGPRIFPSRQEVFFFGVPPGDSSFSAMCCPPGSFPREETYGMPDLESRGFKIAFDGPRRADGSG